MMKSLEIRLALAADVPYLLRLDHTVESTHVWRPEWSNGETLGAWFRPTPLPRPVILPYPYDPETVLEDWRRLPALWVALQDGRPVGYVTLRWSPAPDVAWLSDLVVDFPYRRQGIGQALILHVLRWAAQRGYRRMVWAASFRNHPAISLALRAHLRFVGFQQAFFPNGDTALLLGRDV